MTDLIGLGVNKQDVVTGGVEKQQKDDARSNLPLPIPTNDRPMSLVQELDESAQQTDDEDEQENGQEQKKTVPEVATTKTTIKTTTVLKIPKPSSSSKSISEEEIRKELPNLPRKT